MESLELRIFREVAQESSISKAAENLNYVQSNITAHIKRLEEELGTIRVPSLLTVKNILSNY